MMLHVGWRHGNRGTRVHASADGKKSLCGRSRIGWVVMNTAEEIMSRFEAAVGDGAIVPCQTCKKAVKRCRDVIVQLGDLS